MRLPQSCEAWWEEVDHLSRVAGCGSRQIEKLVPSGITTMRALAARIRRTRPRGSTRDTFAKLQRQAGLQLGRQESGRLATSCSSPRPERGSRLLPEPVGGDLFFDFEGNPFWDKHGSLEYLWGILDAERTLHAAMGRTTPPSAAAPSSRRPHPRAAARVPRHARLPLRRVRDHRAAAARRAATGRARTRSTTCCGAGSSSTCCKVVQAADWRHRRRLRAEGDGGVPEVRAPRGD